MSDLTDLEITKLCADAMGESVEQEYWSGLHRHVWITREWDENEKHNIRYDPLHNDAQCFALVKKLNITLIYNGEDCHSKWTASPNGMEGPATFDADSDDLNRAICLCVARMQKAKP